MHPSALIGAAGRWVVPTWQHVTDRGFFWVQKTLQGVLDGIQRHVGEVRLREREAQKAAQRRW